MRKYGEIRFLLHNSFTISHLDGGRRFLAVFRGIDEVVALLPNPKGIESINLGLDQRGKD
jgi:hypothetical protein